MSSQQQQQSFRRPAVSWKSARGSQVRVWKVRQSVRSEFEGWRSSVCKGVWVEVVSQSGERVEFGAECAVFEVGRLVRQRGL